MNDPELPVKVEAANTLPKLLKWNVTINLIKPEIEGLLRIYLGIINEIDSEDLVDSLESIIEYFSGDITPYAQELTRHL
jgi:hypothetical protein